jgi:hypothetical protein
MNKRAKVHRLPTEKDNRWHICPTIYNLRYITGILTCGVVDNVVTEMLNGKLRHFHLYFTTDEEIKNGDDCIHIGMNRVEQWNNNPELDKSLRRKIIASTDPKLIAEGVAQPSQAFIKAYCEQGGIDEVDVEYGFAGLGSKKGETFRLKVDSTHNTIIIHPVEEKMYSRKEVVSKMRLSIYKGQEENDDLDEEKWINENL